MNINRQNCEYSFTDKERIISNDGREFSDILLSIKRQIYSFIRSIQTLIAPLRLLHGTVISLYSIATIAYCRKNEKLINDTIPIEIITIIQNYSYPYGDVFIEQDTNKLTSVLQGDQRYMLSEEIRMQPKEICFERISQKFRRISFVYRLFSPSEIIFIFTSLTESSTVERFVWLHSGREYIKFRAGSCHKFENVNANYVVQCNRDYEMQIRHNQICWFDDQGQIINSLSWKSIYEEFGIHEFRFNVSVKENEASMKFIGGYF